jgi:hypothetical protein
MNGFQGVSTGGGVPEQTRKRSALPGSLRRLAAGPVTGSSSPVLSRKQQFISGEKMDKFMEHFAREIEQYMGRFGGKLFQ